MKASKGFTLLELVIVFVVIAFLISIIIPAINHPGDSADRIVCGSRIRQITTGLIIYAKENRNRLPECGGWWPWDVSYETTSLMMNAMGYKIENFNISSGQDIPVQKQFYCPYNKSQQKSMEKMWSYYVDPGLGTGNRWLGYGFLWYAGWNENGKLAIRGTDGDRKRFVGRMDIRKPAESELVVDYVLRDSGTENYVNVGVESFLRTSHLSDKKEPVGGNIGFVDGHVEWRNVKYMESRFSLDEGRIEWLY